MRLPSLILRRPITVMVAMAAVLVVPVAVSALTSPKATAGLDPDLYDTEITSPTGPVSSGEPISIRGRARSTDGVAEVRVAVQHRDSNRYWDSASQAWSTDYVQSSARIVGADDTDVGWSVTIPAQQSPAGRYTARAWVRTKTGKGDPFGRGRTAFIVDDGSSPITISPTTVPVITAPTSSGPSTTAPPTSGPTTTAPDPGGRVVWEDTFDRLDRNRWRLEHSTYGDGNNELQCYRPDNVTVADGRLILKAVSETYTCPNGSTRSVTSGMVRSRGVSFEPGQAIEFRVKLNPADHANQGGLWPAVWSSSWADGGWPRGGEMDYLEVMTANDPKRSVYSIHYARPDGSHGVTNRAVVGTENFSARWRTIRFEYGLGGDLRWLLDGVQVHRVTDVDTIQGYPAPFDEATDEIKINLALGGRPGPLDPRAVGGEGATFEVDYIRVVELDPDEPPTTTTRPTTTRPTTTTTRPTMTTTRPTTTTTRPTTTTTERPCADGDPSILLPCQGVLIGATGDFKDDDGSYVHKEQHFSAMEDRLGTDFDLFHDFLQWNDLVGKTWPNSRTQALADDGRLLLTNWKSPTGRADDWGRIAAGQYDDDIANAARQMAAFGRPTFLTFFHEPEDNIRDAADGDPAKVQRYIDDYRDAYRHIHRLFQQNGATNVVWVWDMQGWLRGWEDYYRNGLYPGNDVIDWVAWNPYNWYGCENHGNPGSWKSFTEVISPFYDWLDQGGPGLPGADKPLMLGEWGSEENDGAANSTQTKGQWLDEARRVLPTRFPRLRAVVYFDTEGRRADGSVQFCEWAIDSSPGSMEAMRDLLTDDRLTARW